MLLLSSFLSVLSEMILNDPHIVSVKVNVLPSNFLSHRNEDQPGSLLSDKYVQYPIKIRVIVFTKKLLILTKFLPS